MFTHRRVKTLCALMLATGAVVGATTTGAHAAGTECGVQTSGDQGDPNALPPILRPAQPSELAELRRAEASVGERFSYQLPAGARYSTAEMDAYAASAVH